MYHSAGVFVAEGYPVNKKDFFGVTAETLSTTAAGVDEAIATGNTFTNCAYGYVRMNEFGNDGAGVNVCYVTVGNEGALANAIEYATAQGTVILNNDVALNQMITIGEGKDFTLVLNGHTISNNITYSENTYRMFSLQGGHLSIDGSVDGSTMTTGYNGNPSQAQMRLFQNLNGTLDVNGGSYIGYYAFESNIEASVEPATTTISNAVITAGFSALSNFTKGTMNVSDSTITADYYVLANNGLHGGTHFTAVGCTMTSKEDTAIYFPAGDELTIDSCKINAPKGSGMEAFAGKITVKGDTVISAGAAKTEQVSAAGEGSRMDGSAILIGYRSGYKTADKLILNVADSVTLNSANNGTIRLVQLGNLNNGITAITVTCPGDMAAEHSKFMNDIPEDAALTVVINDTQVRPVKQETEVQAAQENVVVNDEANTDPANVDKNQKGSDVENSGKDNGANGADDETGTSAPIETPVDAPEAE